MSATKFWRTAVALAAEVWSTPEGGWPATQQAIAQLTDYCSGPEQVAEALRAALADGCRVHPDRTGACGVAVSYTAADRRLPRRAEL